MLNDIKIKTSKSADKDYKLSDEKGLYLFVRTTGSKLWRMAYRFDGKQKTLALGQYPEVSLAQAREKQANARKLIAQGIDPGQAKKAAKKARIDALGNSFEAVAREWWISHTKNLSLTHKERVIRQFENYVFPWLGNLPIGDITPVLVLDVVKRIERQNKLETARRTLSTIGQVFRYAVQHGKAERNVAADLVGAIPPPKVKHMASFTEPDDVAEFLRAIEGFKGTLTVQCALRLAPLVFVRPGELRMARWNDIDLEAGEWRYLVSKTKTEHLVPLSRQALEILREIQPVSGHREFVFTGGHDPLKCMSEAAINAALKRMGYDTRTEITGHGFRAMARTLLHERLNIDPHIIEHQLAHTVPDALGRAYNRTRFIAQRREMMQLWADYLDELKAGAKIVPFKKA